jgi:hypothetical protein
MCQILNVEIPSLKNKRGGAQSIDMLERRCLTSSYINVRGEERSDRTKNQAELALQDFQTWKTIPIRQDFLPYIPLSSSSVTHSDRLNVKLAGARKCPFKGREDGEWLRGPISHQLGNTSSNAFHDIFSQVSFCSRRSTAWLIPHREYLPVLPSNLR